MKIFYLTNLFSKTKEMQDKYDFVLDNLLRVDAEIFSNEKGEFLGRRNVIRDEKFHIINDYDYSSLSNALGKSDVLVVENTFDCFQAGQLVTIALQNRKPVLILSSNQEHSADNKSFQNFFNQDAKYLYVESYERYSLIRIIRDFLENVERYYKTEQVHFRLSQDQKNYLGEAAKKDNLAISEYMRKLIEKEIENHN